MIRFMSVLSKEADTATASPMDTPRNWRCELGTFWQDIEDAGSVVRAIHLRSPAASARDRNAEGVKKAGSWVNFRTLCSSIL